jgi:ketosteroid isomerase-like protein
VSGREQQVRDGFAALERGEFEAIEVMFAEDAKWRAPDPEWDCLSRARILEVMRANRADGRLSGEIEQVDELDDAHTLVAFRRAQQEPDAMADEEGLRWVLLSFGQDGLVEEMKGFADRAAATAYAAS